VDVDGRLYVAASLEAGVRVFEDGKPVEFLPIPGEGVTTNCCFGGLDRRWLFATDARRGTIVVWEGMPAPGRPANLWRSP
jgi:sugar lactone lactonase YvrE